MATVVRLEVWSALECEGGTRLELLPLVDCEIATYTERISLENLLSVSVPKAAAAAAVIVLGSVIRQLFDDGSFAEWRVHELNDQTGASGGRLRVDCRGLVFELRDAALLTTTDGTSVTLGRRFDGLDATAAVDLLLTFLPSWWSRGAIASSVVVSFEVADGSPLSALRALVKQCNGNGDVCELDVVRNGVSGYEIAVPAKIGEAAPAVDVRTAKNLLTGQRARSREPLVNTIYPTAGGQFALPLAYLRVAAIAGTDIELRVAESSAGVVGFDGQLDGLYLQNDAGAFTLISASVALTSTVTVASAAGYAVGEWARVVADASGLDFVALAVPGASPPVVKPFDLGTDLVTNLCENPFLSRWPGSASAAPPGWQVPVGTVARNAVSTYIRRGRYSALVGPGAYQMRTDTVNLQPGRGTTYSAKLTIYLVSGTPAVRLYNQASTLLGTLTPVGVGWHENEFTGIATGAATGLYLRVDAGSGSCYVDSAQITWGGAQAAWAQGSNPAVGFSRGNMVLKENGADSTTYVLTVADLNRWSGVEWPDDRLVVGGVLNISDTELDVVYSARITEVTRDLRNPLKTSLVLERLTRTLTRSVVG